MMEAIALDEPPAVDGRSYMRSAKEGSDWSENELYAFNIRVVDANVSDFFNGLTELPAPGVSATILDHLDKPDGPLEKDESLFFRYMRLVERPRSTTSHVNDFALFLLHMMNFDDQERVLCLKEDLSFTMAGECVGARPGICLMDETDCLLLVVQEGDEKYNTEPQIITQAIGAFYRNNAERESANLPILKSQWVSAIMMIGTAPIFYRVRVTTPLLRALETASYPEDETVVLRFIPSVPNQAKYISDGMRSLGNRRVVLQCFEALEGIINLN